MLCSNCLQILYFKIHLLKFICNSQINIGGVSWSLSDKHGAAKIFWFVCVFPAEFVLGDTLPSCFCCHSICVLLWSISTLFFLFFIKHSISFCNKPLVLKLLHVSYLSPVFNDLDVFSPQMKPCPDTSGFESMVAAQ